MTKEVLRDKAADVVRGKAAAKDSDSALARQFAEHSKVTDVRGNGIVKALSQRPPSATEQRLVGDINVRRKSDLAGRDSVRQALDDQRRPGTAGGR